MPETSCTETRLARRVAVGLGVVTIALLAAVTNASPGAPGETTPVQLRLLWLTNPQTAVTVSWTTAKPGKSQWVYFDTKPHAGKTDDYPDQIAAGTNGRWDGDDIERYYHHARLTSLKPGTTYYLTVATDGNPSREIHFQTAPKKDVPFGIIYGADSRSGRDARRKMNRLIAKLVAADKTLLAFAHGGDYVKDGEEEELWDAWLTDHELTIAPDGRMLPLIPARGNHEDSGPLFDQLFDSPGGGLGKNYFALSLGPQVLFLTLNTQVALGGAQAAFLTGTLTTHKKKRWQIAQYHKPAYPAVKRPGGTKSAWVPIFDRFQLDLACEADGHVIKRTRPIRNDKPDPAGTVYIGEGGLGVKPRTPRMGRWYLQAPGKSGRGHHLQILRFGKTQLSIEVRLIGGQIFDQAQLTARKR